MSNDDLLRQVTIAEPCSADWSAMPGDHRARFCALCGKHVYDLEAMPANEAACLIRSRNGALCARLRVRDDPTTAMPAVSARRPRATSLGQFHIRLIMAIIASVGGLLSLTRTWWRAEPPAAPLRSTHVMGRVMYLPPLEPPSAGPIQAEPE